MAAKTYHPGLADLVAIAIGPVLIMALVGSLVFFLLEVLYAGDYQARMQWILFFFVFAIVLIARISIETGSPERAILFGFPLGVLTLIALQLYVVSSWPINLALMAFVWWSAHRLTWDCTWIDDDEAASGEGVLQAAGLDAAPGDTNKAESAPDQRKPRKESEAIGIEGWWARYRRYREERAKRPRTPGVWVVYFSLAALPLFGLGQSLVPPDAIERRRYTFWLMSVYVGSGLGLLLTTSFLGLRRYLRQRRLEMPKTMTALWLGVGTAMIAALLLVGTLLPRPHTEYPLLELAGIKSPERKASDWAILKDSPGKDDARTKAESPTGKDAPKSKDSSSNTSAKQGKDKGDGASSSSKDSGSKDGGSKEGGSKDGREGKTSKDSSSSKAESKTGKAAGKEGQEKQAGQQSESGSKASSASSSGSSLPPVLERVTTILRWVVFGLLALIVAGVVLWAALRHLGQFTNWARRLLDALRALWESLFGVRQEGIEDGEAEKTGAREPPPRPFSSFANPFSNGSAEGMKPNEWVRYTFEAFEAWARERDLGRQPEETPREFAERVGEEVPELAADAERLAALYARVNYGRGSLSPACREPLEQFWQQLEATVEPSLSEPGA